MVFSKDKIDEIRSASDILELISDYLPLKRVGKYYRALCPFHDEKQPSFYVNPERQIFHCFGCGKGGNVFSFLMEYEKFSFPESVEFLARRSGIPIEKYTSKSAVHELDQARNSLYRANDFAAEFYHKQLLANGEAQKYLISRGIEEWVIDKFRLGYAPDSWDSLIKAAKKKSISIEVLREAGLVLSGAQRPYDMFRNRIVFPIFNLSKRVIGFAGRCMDDSTPKYINSSETLIYKKGEILFGLNQSKADIRKIGFAILVEGYTDFLALYTNEIKNCVATCGTAFTKKQVRLISRYCEKVTLVYDSDSAGVASSLRSIDLLLGENLDVNVVNLPEGEDPDSYIRKKGTEEFKSIVQNADNFLSFKLKLMDRSEVSEKARSIRSIVDSIQQIPDGIKRTLWFRELSRKTGVGEKVLMKHKVSNRPVDSLIQTFEVPRTESELLGMMVKDMGILSKVRSALEIEDFSQALTRKLASVLFGIDYESAPADLLNNIQDAQLRDFLAGCIFSIESSPIGEELVDDYIQKIRTATIDRRLRELKKEIEEQEKKGDLDYELLREHQRLSELKRGA